MSSKGAIIILLIMVAAGLGIGLKSTAHAACPNGVDASDDTLTCDDNSNVFSKGEVETTH